jgi:hypothetical protein
MLSLIGKNQRIDGLANSLICNKKKRRDFDHLTEVSFYLCSV